jgi:hypothetical protein
MQIPDDGLMKEFAKILVQQSIYNEEQVDELLCALVVLRDFSTLIWNESFTEAMSALQDINISKADKKGSLIGMQIYLREIYLQLNDLKWFGIEAT